ncbi:MAG: hypothetical protein IJF83_11565 [Methanobrevibacter sp.]|nr:hypothetical protein [Methanobrevibacter sp.]
MKRILIVCIFLALVISLSPVLAQDNASAVSSDTAADEAYINITVSDEIVVDEPLELSYRTLNFEPICANLSVYIDGEFCRDVDISNSTSGIIHLNPKSHEIGKHVCKVVFSGSELFKPFNRTLEYSVTNISCILKDLYEADEAIEVKLPGDAVGTVTVTINQSTTRYDLKRENATKIIARSLQYFSYGKYDVEITYSGNYPGMTKRATVYRDFQLKLSGHDFPEISKHSTVLIDCGFNDFSLFIDGVEVDCIEEVITDDDDILFCDYFIAFNKLSLCEGYHSLELRVAPSEYHHAKTLKETFHVKYSYLADSKSALVNSVYPITFIFPDNVAGNLSVYAKVSDENYTLVGCSEIINSTASVNCTFTKTGTNHIMAVYDTNYGKGETHASFDIAAAEISFDTTIGVDRYYGEDFTLNAGEGVFGNFSVYINGKLYKSQNITGPTSQIRVPNVFESAGKYVITAAYDTNYGSANRSTNEITVTDAEGIAFTDGGYDMTIYYGADDVKANKRYGNVKLETYWGHTMVQKNYTVTYKIGKQSFSVKTDREGFATLKVPNTITPGTYVVSINYKGVKISKKLIVKQVLTLKSQAVKRSAKKLTLQATLKGKTALKYKQVTFKFNGKVYRAKTNSKGIAKVTVPKSVLSKLKVGKRITYQVTYLKNTVKRTAVVKR